MSERAAPSPLSESEMALPTWVAGALDPARAGQLQELIEAEVAQRLQAERLWLEAQIAAQLEVQIATRLEAQLAARLEAQISARLEAQFDSRVAHEVAQKVQQIIEQN